MLTYSNLSLIWFMILFTVHPSATFPLSYTFIPNNLASADINLSYMDSFLADEVASGHMDGPYSIETVHHIFNGHFRTAPLGFVEKLGSSALNLICHHSKEDHLGSSTNGWIHTSPGATKFYSAVHAAKFVSFATLIKFPPPPHQPLKIPCVIYMMVIQMLPFILHLKHAMEAWVHVMLYLHASFLA